MGKEIGGYMHRMIHLQEESASYLLSGLPSHGQIVEAVKVMEIESAYDRHHGSSVCSTRAVTTILDSI